VFKLRPDGSNFSVLVDFDDFGTGGGPSNDGLTLGTDGALYGTASEGGVLGNGTVFRVNPNDGGLTVLQALDGATTGGNPYGGLMQGADGALYGTTGTGGSMGFGTVFRLTLDGTELTVLQNLDNLTTGGVPNAGLVQGPDGVLYGTTTQGGSGGAGTVFSVNPDGTGFAVLQNFDNLTTGGDPYGRLAWGADGNLYGTTVTGGENGFGSVFRFVFNNGPCAGKADGTPCDDGDACTQTDSCVAGSCVGANPVICTALDQCHDAGTCAVGTGVCSNPVKPDGSGCDDGNACTTGEVCAGGQCGGGRPVTTPVVNDSVRVGQGGVSAAITWNDLPGTFNVYRGTMAPGTPWAYNQVCLSSSIVVMNATDAATPPLSNGFFYLVTRVGACGESIPGTNSAGQIIPNNSPCP
jgi:uncharacterized repeat protein (TIGR03803 family)